MKMIPFFAFGLIALQPLCYANSMANSNSKANSPTRSPAKALAKSSYERFPAVNKGGTYSMGTHMTPTTLNPILVNKQDDQEIVSWLFLPLLQTDAETDEFTPALADKLEISKDEKVYTYQLNAHATWSDGTPLTSDDLEFTFQKMMDPKVDAAVHRSQFEGITFQKIDATHVQFTVAKPKYNTIEVLNDFRPVQKKQFENESDFNKSAQNLHPISNAAYQFKSLSRDQMVVLERVKNWWAKDLPPYRATANFDVLQFKIIPDLTLTYENFLKGNIDSAGLSSDQYALQVKGVDRERVGDSPQSGKPVWAKEFPTNGSLNWFGLAVNLKNSILSSLKVRQALANLIDYQTIIEKAFYGTVEQCVSPFGSRTPNVPPALRGPAHRYHFDLKKAAELLKQDGWADTDGDNFLDKMIEGKKTKLAVHVKAFMGSQPASKTLQLMKEDFKKAGIELTLVPMDGSALYKDFEDKNFELALMGWGGGSIHPDPQQLWATSSIEGGSNKSSYSNSKVDALIEKANLEFNPKKREKMIQEISQILYDELPYLFLVEKKFVLQGINSRIKSPIWVQKYSTDLSKDLFHL